jgi:hypothetical protein
MTNPSITRRGIQLLPLALLAATVACSVSDQGLGVPRDAGASGVSGLAACPEGLTDQAGWPVRATSNSCTQPCGPDGIGVRTCSQIDRANCQKKSGCVCLEAPCVGCLPCEVVTKPDHYDCYIPANAAEAPACAKKVANGKACSPACSMHLCLQHDGKSGCVCNAEGKYACATWGDSGWE